ncbi:MULTISPECIES: outer membrane beta-barrel protein [unclassified Fibrobacter]|uniref:outer membrane beta-barrel protein n=1 Tax=unclassified Fibrobacter TaxID=2634177 RepID=UPI000D6BC16F|nr:MULTISPECIES: outer membrane beta-barrel protein [unclassified Fibrobacter]PWJ61258.1 outer membrane protein with beta-barrel domain [Fibrobacter sp. UWR4]PZW66097.1 outer membrane protein with beta-barrel domain [Fibrobacter sp. UWR1]
MKKTMLIFCLLIAGLFTTQALAENYWPKSYFVQAGVNGGYSNGDLNERALSLEDTTGEMMKVYPPDIGFLISPEIVAGVNMRFFSLSILFQYTTRSTDMVDFDDDKETDMTFWRFGFEFVYNINWPEDFQVGLGLGYSFSTLKASSSSFIDDEAYNTEYMGLGVNFILNAHYYFTEHIAIVPSVKIYENWFKNIYTKASELCDADPYLWQTFFTAGLSIQYQF